MRLLRDLLDGSRETLVLLGIVVLQSDLELDRLAKLALLVLRALQPKNEITLETRMKKGCETHLNDRLDGFVQSLSADF